MSEIRDSKTRFARRRVYTVSAQLGFCSLNMIKFVYVEFLLSKQQSFLKFTFNRARSTLYRSRWRKFQEKELLNNNIFSTLSLCTLRGLVVTLWPGAVKVLSSITGITYFSFFLLLFFFLFVQFSFQLLQFCFFIQLQFFYIYKFSSVLPIFPFNFLPFPRSPS